jgi:hypothetical protein
MTALDPRYSPEQHRAAYQERLRDLRRMGIPLPAGAVIDEPQRSIYDLDDPDTMIADNMVAFDAELKDIERADAKATAEQRLAADGGVRE